MSIILAEIGDASTGELLKLKKHPSPNELNLLCLLASHMDKYLSADEICARLNIKENHFRVLLTTTRKKLESDWNIQTKPRVGSRLVYIGHALQNVERTYMMGINYKMVDGRRFNRGRPPVRSWPKGSRPKELKSKEE